MNPKDLMTPIRKPDPHLKARSALRLLRSEGSYLKASPKGYVIKTPNAPYAASRGMQLSAEAFDYLVLQGVLAPRTEGGYGLTKAYRLKQNESLTRTRTRISPDINPTPRVWTKRPSPDQGPVDQGLKAQNPDSEVLFSEVLLTFQKKSTACAIDWLASRKDSFGNPWLSQQDIAAADRLIKDYERALQLGPGLRRLDQPCRAPHPGLSSDQPMVLRLTAKENLNRALDILGVELAAVVKSLCFEGLGLEACEKRLRLGRHRARAYLKAALQKLSEHYGF